MPGGWCRLGTALCCLQCQHQRHLPEQSLQGNEEEAPPKFYYFLHHIKMKPLETSEPPSPSGTLPAIPAVLQQHAWLRACFCPACGDTVALRWPCPAGLGSRALLRGVRSTASLVPTTPLGAAAADREKVPAAPPVRWLQKCSPVISQETFTWINVASLEGGSVEQPLPHSLISCNQRVSVSHAVLYLRIQTSTPVCECLI